MTYFTYNIHYFFIIFHNKIGVIYDIWWSSFIRPPMVTYHSLLNKVFVRSMFWLCVEHFDILLKLAIILLKVRKEPCTIRN